MPPLSILIMGCGVAGPTLASFLLLGPQPAEEKPHITILERSTAFAHGQNIDIRGAGVTVMRKLGMESAIRSSTTGEEGVQFVDKNNKVWAAFGADKSGKVQTGTSDIEILRGRLAEICYKRSQAVSEEVKRDGGRGIEYIFGDYAEELEQDGEKVHVRFAKSGERRSFDIIVGADGLQSRTRRMAFQTGPTGEEDCVKRLGMYGGFFSMPRSSTDSEWRRWFHAPGRRGIMVRPHHDKDKSTVFMAVINDQDTRLREVAAQGHKGVEAQKARMAEYFQDCGWECPRIIKEMHAADDFYYDMIAQVKMERWSKGRVVLLGDAGYCASPISGMGTTLALVGAYNLAGAITQQPKDISAAFEQYEQVMRPVVAKAQKLAPGAPHVFNPETAWGIWFMHAIFWLLGASGIVNVIAKYVGPPANKVPVEDYGFKQLEEWQGYSEVDATGKIS